MIENKWGINPHFLMRVREFTSQTWTVLSAPQENIKLHENVGKDHNSNLTES